VTASTVIFILFSSLIFFGSNLYHRIYGCVFCMLLFNFVNYILFLLFILIIFIYSNCYVCSFLGIMLLYVVLCIACV
jgi:hypothetical protein